jgi:glucose/arabinose dehydrogenase
MNALLLLLPLAGIALAAPTERPRPKTPARTATVTRAAVAPDPDNGGLKLATGFGALVVTPELGKARHIAVDPGGTVFVKLDKLKDGKGIAQLRDTNGDGRADETTYFGTTAGTGMAVQNGYLYASSDSSVYRYKLTNGVVAEETPAEPLVTGLTFQRQHGSKSLAVSPDGRLFVNFGAPSNACQEKDRTAGSKGQDPCPLLENYGGIWVFDAAKPNQRQTDGRRYATGIRNAVALDFNTTNNTLYALQHGRDMLATLYPALYTNEQSAELPNEEFLRVTDGADFGWPYCYNDMSLGQKVLAPEYGGNGQVQDRCAGKEKPIMAFPGHWAPNDLLFYTGNAFPARYRNGAFVCFHGSWNRAPLKQGGYFVAFIPMNKSGQPAGPYEVFAENFAGVSEPGVPGKTTDAGKPDLASPADAKHRPMGLAQGPDGSLYISDSVKGTVWRVVYTAKK